MRYVLCKRCYLGLAERTPDPAPRHTIAPVRALKYLALVPLGALAVIGAAIVGVAVLFHHLLGLEEVLP